MAEYDDVFPTRFGTPQGSSTERVMLDKVQGAHTIRTEIRDNPDGTKTRLRTRAGMPVFTTDEEKKEAAERVVHRGLVAYPHNDKADAAWSKPCVLEWDLGRGAWKTVAYNPAQTSKGLAEPPQHSTLSVFYWTSATGDTCISCEDRITYGLKHKGSMYTKVVEKKYGGEGTPNIPFVVDDNYLVIIQSAGDTTLMDTSGVEQYKFTATHDYGGTTGIVAFDIALPAAVSTVGDKVVFNRAIARLWESSPLADPRKYYAHAVLNYVADPAFSGDPIFVATVTNTSLMTYGIHNMHHEGTRAYDDDMSGMSMPPIPAYAKYNGDGDGAGHFACRPTNGEGSLTDSYNPIYYIPKHQTFTVAESEDGWAFSTRVHEGRRDEFTFVRNAEKTIIGKVAKGAELVPIEITLDSNLNYLAKADGYQYRVDADLVDRELWPGRSIMCLFGITVEEGFQRKINNTADDTITITGHVGDFEIKLYEHRGTTAASSFEKDGQNITGVTTKAGGILWLEGEEGTLDKARWFSNSDVRACTFYGVPENPYPGDPIGVEYQAMPTVSRTLGVDDTEKYSGVWKPFRTFSPYAGTLTFDATSRTVLALDCDLSFAAYVEVAVASTLTFASDADTWHISQYSTKLECQHTISAHIVVEYKGEKHTKELFSTTALKPFPADIQQIEDWLSWPWVNSIPGSVNLFSAPRVTPDTKKFSNIDNLFKHQGVCPDLAGIPVSEDPERDPPIDPRAQCIYAKRFTIKDITADWILDDYSISQGKKTPNGDDPDISIRYYYCPHIKKLVEDDHYQIEFDQNGLRAWLSDIPAKGADSYIAPQPDRSSVCYRV